MLERVSLRTCSHFALSSCFSSLLFALTFNAQDPAKMMEMMADPDVARFFEKIQGAMGGIPGMGGGGMGGMGGTFWRGVVDPCVVLH